MKIKMNKSKSLKNGLRLSFLPILVFLTGCSTTSSQGDIHSGHASRVGVAKPNEFWWPKRVNLSPLRQSNEGSNPMGRNFNYAQEFKKLNIKAVKKDLENLMKSSQDWWPADFGHYGPLFIRMAWHTAGTYRISDGRGGAIGGQQRFEPLNSWPDNANLDKARRLLWPIKKKYGAQLSWADLMVLAGNVALESMGFQVLGFSGGRSDDYEPDFVYWGPENKFLDAKRRTKEGKLKKPFGATQMGLIYVNPEGPNGKPDPKLAAQVIRETFGRMALNDEETVALIAGGHTIGKAHGAKKAGKCLGPAPAGASLQEQGLGWKNRCGTGKGGDTITSGLEGAWTSAPTRWSMQYLQFLYGFNWEMTKSPAGHVQWRPKEKSAENLVPDAFVKGKRHAPMMLTTDLALKFDPKYRKITQRWLKNPKEFKKAFARAWFKLTHRDMGPRARYVGSEVPKEVMLWQDPIPVRKYKVISQSQANQLKRKILKSGLSVPELIRTAWASAASYRGTDMRGGTNGGRVRLKPQKNWPVNNPTELRKVMGKLDGIRKRFNAGLPKGKKISMADTIVLGGYAALEKAASRFGVKVNVSLKPGRTDATQQQTDVRSFSVLEPRADGFRNYYSKRSYLPPVRALIDRANLLGLTVPEMTVLVGGLRVLGANTKGSKNGVFTRRVGTLSNDFFVNLLDMSTQWKKSSKRGLYNGMDRKTGKVKYTATPVDLVFGSSSELRAVSEVYAADDAKSKFVKDFVRVWKKIMNYGRWN